MTWVRVGDTDIHYIESGVAGGPPLVLLHGFGSCAESWFHQADVLGCRCRILAYDSVNHGHSSLSPDGEPEPDRVDELVGFLDALEIERPVLMGNSMGALTILRWATRYTNAARAIVASGMGVAGPDDRDIIPPGLFKPVENDVLFLPADAGFTSGFPSQQREAYERYVRLRSTATRIQASRRSLPPTMHSPSRQELAGLVARITSPMQIVVGEHDWLHDAAVRLHGLVPHSRFAEIPGAPHNAYFETPDPYNDVVTQFLDEMLTDAN
jgi:pimeloyl-ACP methyl ester carboxylesterase